MTLTFDLLTLKVVSESRVTWATYVPILVFLALCVASEMVKEMTSTVSCYSNAALAHLAAEAGATPFSPSYSPSFLSSSLPSLLYPSLCWWLEAELAQAKDKLAACSALFLSQWLRPARLNGRSTAILPPFDCHPTAVRLRYYDPIDLPVCRLLHHRGLNKVTVASGYVTFDKQSNGRRTEVVS